MNEIEEAIRYLREVRGWTGAADRATAKLAAKNEAIREAEDLLRILSDDVFDLNNGEVSEYYKQHLERTRAVLAKLENSV